MQLFQNIIIGIATLVSGFFGSAQHFGNIALTTLNGSDRQNVFPTTYNANNTALNNGKIDVGSTSIAAIITLGNLTTTGTLISGALGTGFTAVNVPQGGTGSTTLSANQVLLGNGTSLMKTVSGWGTSGQFLTSTGAGTAPTWQSGSFDLTGSYVNTGVWTFSNAINVTGTSYLKALVASSTITISNGGAGVSYSFPTSQGAANTVLTNDGSGNLSWNTGTPKYNYVVTSGGPVLANVTSTSYATSSNIVVPAGLLTGSSTIQVKGNITCNVVTAGSPSCTFYLRASTGITIASCSSTYSANSSGYLDFDVFNQSSASSQKNMPRCTFISPTAATFGTPGSSAINLGAAVTLNLVVQSAPGGSLNSTASIDSYSVLINP